MSLLKSLAKETFIYGLSYSLGKVLNFLLVTSYLSRVFHHETAYLSIYQDLYFYIGLGIGILSLRMETSLFRFLSDPKTKDTIFALASQWILLGCGFFLIAVLLFINPIEEFLKYPDARQIIYYAAIIIILDVFAALPFAKIRYDNKPKRYAWIKLLGIFIHIGLVLLFLQLDKGSSVHDKFEWVVIANVISSFVVFVLVIPEFKAGFKKTDWSFSKILFRYSWPLLLVTLAFLIIQNGSVSFLKYLLPDTTEINFTISSQFVAASRLAILMSLFVTAFNYAAEPFFFRHADKTDARPLYAKVSLYFTVSCCFIYIVSCLFIDVAAILLDKNFRSALHLVSILMLANIFSGIYTNFSSWYKLSDRTGIASVISLSGLLITIVLNLIFIPVYGIDAAAWSILVSYVFIACISYIQGQKHYPIPYDIMRMSLYLISSIAIVYGLPKIAEGLDLQVYIQYAMKILVIGLFCLIVYWDLHRIKMTEETPIR